MKNICLTLAQRHQKHQCYALLKNVLLSDEVYTKGKLISIDKLNSEYLQLINHLLGCQTSIYSIQAVSVGSSVSYKVGFCLVKETHPHYIFWKIDNIFVINSVTCFIMREMETLFFDLHYNAWILHTTSRKVVVQRAEFPYFYPLALYQLNPKYVLS